ncbi:MAG: hypothetical protein PHF17_05045 [Arcobacteraceae bacterium]|jgi:hypothetical protein|nr:hypothetical protein [Arcobacteraceae bacterium]
MQKESILYILTQHGVNEDDLKVFQDKLKKEKNFTIADCDRLLLKMGYDKVFTDDEELDDEENDSYTPYEKTKPKHHDDN